MKTETQEVQFSEVTQLLDIQSGFETQVSLISQLLLFPWQNFEGLLKFLKENIPERGKKIEKAQKF